jgi:hypothetical protein
VKPIFKNLLSSSHEQILASVEKVLAGADWEVSREEIVGAVRPDIVARKPGGPTYVIEVKERDLDANFGAVAQVETFRNAVAAKFGGEAKGLLMIAGEPSTQLSAVAKKANVTLVQADSADIGSIRSLLTDSGVF